MTFDAFWNIIDEARHSTKRVSDIPDWLVEHLSHLAEKDIADFQVHLRECMRRSYDARLWLGAVVVLGGCGDDSFDCFRAWLIAQGRGAFELVLANTDSMSALQSFDGDYGVPRLERMLYAPTDAFVKRAGGDEFTARERFESLLPPRQRPTLQNKEFANASEQAARELVPRLAARFPAAIASRKER